MRYYYHFDEADYDSFERSIPKRRRRSLQKCTRMTVSTKTLVFSVVLLTSMILNSNLPQIEAFLGVGGSSGIGVIPSCSKSTQPCQVISPKPHSSAAGSVGVGTPVSLWSTREGGGIDGGLSLKEKEQEEKRREFELALGKAADTLRTDYPKVLSHCPRFDIFDHEIELVDPSGVKLHGIQNYKRTFGILRAIIKFFYNEQLSEVSSRLMFDYATKAIRVTWHATLVPKVIYGGPGRTVYLDGISVYEMDRKSCRIYQHRLERACMNNQPLRYPQGIWRALTTEIVEPHGIPVGGGYCSDSLTAASVPALASKLDQDSTTQEDIFGTAKTTSTGSTDGDGNLWKYGDSFKRTGFARQQMAVGAQGSMTSRRRLRADNAAGRKRLTSTSLRMTSSSSSIDQRGIVRHARDSGHVATDRNNDIQESFIASATVMSSSSQGQSAVANDSTRTKEVSSLPTEHADTVAMASMTDNKQSTSHNSQLEIELERKNRSRIKFGLEPMSMDDYLVQRQQVETMEQQQREKMRSEQQKRAMAAEATLAAEQKKKRQNRNPLNMFLSSVTPARCESNEDCEDPLLCCDFIFKKICCANGTPVGHYDSFENLALVPVPAQPDPEYPQNF